MWVTLTSGKGALGTRWFRVRYVHPGAELEKMHLSLGARILVNYVILGVCELALKPRVVQKGLYPENDEEPRPKPDSGNPTVRDCREACGNVNYGKS